MLIDNVNISNFNAMQTNADIQNSSFSNESEWLKNSLTPIFLENYIGFKTIKLELYFRGNSRDETLKNISNLMSKLKKEVVLKLDQHSNYYKCILNNHEIVKTSIRFAYKLNLEFKGYEHGDEAVELMSRITSKTINVVGNTETPAIIEIVPSIDTIDLILTGLGDNPITIKNLAMSKKIILDGESGIVTQDGVNKFADTDLWNFPSLKPGSNTIKVSRNTVDITIKYKPRWI